MSPLDRPIWSALTSRQAQFARGAWPALAFHSDVEPFAAAESDDPVSLEALGALCPRGDMLVLIQAAPSPPLPGLRLLEEAVGVQMVADREIESPGQVDAVPLADADAADMIALAGLTRPRPFRSATHRLGQFWGIRVDGRLAAMAGERLKLDGMTEVSGVCTHPNWRGRGYARQLSALVASEIQRRGETAFLHVYAQKLDAIRLYEELGFAARRRMAVQAFLHVVAPE